MIQRFLFLLFGVLDIALFVRLGLREFNQIGALSRTNFFAGFIFVAHLIFLTSLVISAIGLIFMKRWALVVSFIQFPFRFIFMFLSFGFISTLASLLFIPKLYHPLIYAAMLLECARLICSVYVYQTHNTTPELAVARTRRTPIFGVLSLLFPTVGIPIALIMAQEVSGEGEGWGRFAALLFFSGIPLFFGFTSVMVSLIRWEKCGFLPLIGFAANIFPVAWFFHKFSPGNFDNLIFATVFCLTFGVVSLAKKEKGKEWASLAAIPSAVLLIFAFGSIAKTIIDQKHSTSAAAHYAADHARYELQIESDPQIAMRERWDIANDSRWKIFSDSFGNTKIKFTEPLLKQIYTNCPGMREFLFRDPACSTKFLSDHFDEAYERCKNINYEMLASIVSNTNTPIDLIEKVASSGDLPVGAVYPARAALKARQNETKAP